MPLHLDVRFLLVLHVEAPGEVPPRTLGLLPWGSLRGVSGLARGQGAAYLPGSRRVSVACWQLLIGLLVSASMPTSTMNTDEHQASSRGHRTLGTCRTAGLPTVGTGIGSSGASESSR